MSGTRIAYAKSHDPMPTQCPSMCLRCCYAMPGTDTTYGATRHIKAVLDAPVARDEFERYGLRVSPSCSGTDVLYNATRARHAYLLAVLVLMWCMMLHVSYTALQDECDVMLRVSDSYVVLVLV
eukprot:86832-Rhodomonas_salina.2